MVTKFELADPIIQNVIKAKEGDPCFLCHDPIHTPFVYWQGAGGHIALHPMCAKNLAVHLTLNGNDSETMRRVP